MFGEGLLPPKLINLRNQTAARGLLTIRFLQYERVYRYCSIVTYSNQLPHCFASCSARRAARLAIFRALFNSAGVISDSGLEGRVAVVEGFGLSSTFFAGFGAGAAGF